MPSAWLILPTYNEAENLEQMVHAAEIAEVRVLHRTHKDGLGRAYLAGFAAALEGGADLILQMDCDFSHDPADVPRLIAATSDADVSLGSRYVPGGGVENWALRRRIQSRGGCSCAGPYGHRLLGIDLERSHEFEREITGGCEGIKPGWVRINFNYFVSDAVVDYLV